MKIANPTRFITACTCFALVVGGLGYAGYTTLVRPLIPSVQAEAEPKTAAKSSDNGIAVASDMSQAAPTEEALTEALLDDVHFIADGIVGTDYTLKWKEGALTLTFAINQDLATAYYPTEKATERLFLQVPQLLTLLSHVTEIERVQTLTVTYSDARLQTEATSSDKWFSMTLNGDTLRNTTWDSMGEAQLQSLSTRFWIQS